MAHRLLPIDGLVIKLFHNGINAVKYQALYFYQRLVYAFGF